jgi:biopolymer transport protein ExbD
MRSRVNLDLQSSESEIDMTPMLDIVFIMLIFFIVSTTFVKEAGVEINRPTASTAEEQENAGVMVAVTADGLIWLEGNQTDVRMIRPKLERLKVEQPDVGVMVQADENAKTGLLIKVMDQIKLAGIEQIAVATKLAQGAL